MRRMLLAFALSLAACKPGSKPVGDPHPKPPAITERFAQMEAVARIERLNERELVLARAGKPLRVQVGPHTMVFLGGRLGSVGELRPGMRVRVSYDAISAAPRANWIIVVPEEPEPRENPRLPLSGI